MALPTITVRFDEPPPLGITWEFAKQDAGAGGTIARIETIHAGTPAASKGELRAGLQVRTAPVVHASHHAVRHLAVRRRSAFTRKSSSSHLT